MVRAPHQTDFTVDVEGIGTFTFARRRMADEFKIQTEYARILDGVKPTDWLDLVAGWKSVLSVLTVKAPEGWGRDIFGEPTENIDDMDPMDKDVYARIGRVFKALTDKERSFRSGPAKAGPSDGEGSGGVA